MPTLKDITSRSYHEQCSNKAHFEITEIDNNIGLKLAVIPLTESRDKYLCIYLQLPPEMRIVVCSVSVLVTPWGALYYDNHRALAYCNSPMSDSKMASILLRLY